MVHNTTKSTILPQPTLSDYRRFKHFVLKKMKGKKKKAEIYIHDVITLKQQV